MEQHKVIREIEATAKLAGVTMQDVCAAAGISQPMVSRWKGATKATHESLMALKRAADVLLEADKAA